MCGDGASNGGSDASRRAAPQGRQDIPLTRIGQPMTLEELEGQAAELARFLQVPIEGL